MSSTFRVLPDGTVQIGFGPDSNCTLDSCPIELSVFQYRPSLVANAVLLSIFGVLLCVHAVQGILLKTWGYMACMVAGCVLQMVGYGGRIMLYDNPFDFNAFLMQIICITVAPVFYCAAIYVLLAKLIMLADPSLSRFNPKIFYYAFIPADVICLVLQATGGALSATGQQIEDVNTGVDVSKAGLILQVVVLVFFLSFFTDYLVLYRKHHRNSEFLRSLKVFLGFIYAAVVMILVRCIYRIIELKDGYFGEGFRQEGEFIGLEGAVMCLAVVCLIIANPGMSLYRAPKAKDSLQEDIELRSADADANTRAPSSVGEAKEGMA